MFFRKHCNHELAWYEGNGSPPPKKNAARRKMCWGVSGRTLAFVLDHIAAGNNLRVAMPHVLDDAQDGEPGGFVVMLFLVHAEDTARLRYHHWLTACAIYGGTQHPPPPAE
jgi:hypothetical protein